MKIQKTEYIRFKCNRCGKEVNASLSRVTYKNHGGTHRRVDCVECGKFIKYLGKDEVIDDFQEHPDYPEDEYILNRKFVTLDELSLKLDLILDHLGIKN